MCMGGGGRKDRGPDIIQQEPDLNFMAQNNAAMEQFRQQQAEQARLYQQQISQQIAAITAETQRMQAQYEQQLAEDEAARAAAEAASQSAYKTSNEKFEFTDSAQTSEELVKPTEKSRSTLKIASGSVKTKAGTGLNIGV